MSTATLTENHLPPTTDRTPIFSAIECTDRYITATLSDGRIVSVPLWWSWRLAEATSAERANFQIIGAGHIAYWPDVDEHLSVQSFFTGSPAPRSGQHLIS